ncbi:cation:proton antiporter [Streptomyces sp. NPDC053367]|uniref:cation:proton antiporter n=1 Tax=Streptomyces sp. NPDC053367 TaxID=3365700 RepID=UPI0037D6EBE7
MDLSGRFLLGLACLLLVTRAAGLIARRARQPAVLAELTAGILLGPSLFGLLAPDAHALLYGADVLPLLDGLGQLGLVLLALRIGRLLARGEGGGSGERGTVLAVGAAGFLLPFAAGVPLALTLCAPYAGEHATPVALALFLGGALGVTAVPVLARLLQDEGLTDSRAGRIALAAAAAGDAAVWVVLTAALAAAGRLGPGRVALVGAGLLLCAALLRWRGSGAPGAPADAGVLVAGCALAAAASSAAGLHQLLGAVVFGFVWGRRRPVEDPAALRLDTVVDHVLLPCFFLGFGQRVDLGGVAWDARFALLLAVLLSVAVVVKAVGCAGAGVLRGLPSAQWLRLGVLMNARGLTEIVVLWAGFDAGLIDRGLLVALTVVALATTAMAGPGLRLVDRLRPLPAGHQMPLLIRPTVKGSVVGSSPN